MLVDVMGNPNTIMRPLYDRKPNSKKNFIIQIAWIINENLKWNCHVDYNTAKASKKLYAIRLLKRAGACKARHAESL